MKVSLQKGNKNKKLIVVITILTATVASLLRARYFPKYFI